MAFLPLVVMPKWVALHTMLVVGNQEGTVFSLIPLYAPWSAVVPQTCSSSLADTRSWKQKGCVSCQRSRWHLCWVPFSPTYPQYTPSLLPRTPFCTSSQLTLLAVLLCPTTMIEASFISGSRTTGLHSRSLVYESCCQLQQRQSGIGLDCSSILQP